jgi:hypothetical protein
VPSFWVGLASFVAAMGQIAAQALVEDEQRLRAR